MKKKIICFTINSYSQAKEIIVESKKNTIFPIIYIKYHIANGFGIEWIKALNRILIDSFSNKSFKIFVDCNNNFSLATQLIGEQIHYLKLKADPLTLKKINDIAKKNRVLLNPKIRIVDLSNIKKISKKISLIESRG